MMVVPMMVTMVHDHDDLSLCRIGHCKAEKEKYADPEFVHAPL
jgi:hypothetical protein